MKIKEIREMDKKEIEEKIKELRKDLMIERMQVSMHTQLKSPKIIKQKKKTIARMLTVLQTKNGGSA